MNATPPDARDVPEYVAAAARLLAMPLEGERFEAVVAVMRRIATFAGDVGAVELSPDSEIAGVFIP
jgi:hypothetical protein